MNDLIKEKLKELLSVCLDCGFTFQAEGKYFSVYKVNGNDVYSICSVYSIQDWNGMVEERIADIDSFIEQVKNA